MSVLVVLHWHYTVDYCNKLLCVGIEIMMYLNSERPVVVISDPGVQTKDVFSFLPSTIKTSREKTVI